MLAEFYIAGYLEQMPVIDKEENPGCAGWIMVRTERAFRNSDGTLSTDLLKVWMRRGCLDECKARCTVGTPVFICGRVESLDHEGELEMRMVGEKFKYYR